MTRNEASADADPEDVRRRVATLIENYESELRSGELRTKVLALVPVLGGVRELGKALIPTSYASSARDRILFYLRRYPQTVVSGDELLIVSGIQEYARRVRELRVQFGWAIASGVTISEMEKTGDEAVPELFGGMKSSDYVLLRTEQDRDAAYRWNTANAIRRERASIRDRILRYLRANAGQPVTGEELRYVGGDKTEWARRVRELRTELGWPIMTKSTGRPDLPVGMYVLEADRQSPEHDRRIPDEVRRDVLRRDNYRCSECGWSYEEWSPADPRHLELHHRVAHVRGGGNTEDNLTTLCVPCHDREHSK